MELLNLLFAVFVVFKTRLFRLRRKAPTPVERDLDSRTRHNKSENLTLDGGIARGNNDGFEGFPSFLLK